MVLVFCLLLFAACATACYWAFWPHEIHVGKPDYDELSLWERLP